MSKRMWLWASLFGAAVVGSGASGRAFAAPPPETDRFRDVEFLLEPELWRSGGARPEELVEFFGRAVAAGQGEMISAIERVFIPLFDRRTLDPNLFGRFMPRLEELGLADTIRSEMKLYNLRESQREDLYRSLLRSGKVNYEYGLSWTGAACQVFWEQMDTLIPEVQAAIASQPQRAPERRSIVKYLREVDLPLAYARRSADPIAEYMKLIREGVAAQADVRDTDKTSTANRLVREALLELVRRDQRAVVPELKSLWRSLREPEHETPARLQARAADAARGLVDPDYPRNSYLAADLERAIRGLGEISFQEKNTRRAEVRQSLEKDLVEQGLLAPRSKEQQ